MAPAWSELGKDFEADPLVKIGRLDCTESESVCRDIEVRGYPTLVYFRDGEVVEPFKGNRYVFLIYLTKAFRIVPVKNVIYC